MWGFELLLPILLVFKGTWAQWNVWMPRDISTMTNSCVVIPCTFMYPSGVRPYRGIHGIWYFGQPYPQFFPPVVFKSRTDIVHESYKGRTKLLGDLQQRNCTLQINNIGIEHSGRYYFRADLGGTNIFTYPDFSEVKVLDQPIIELPEEIISNQSLEVTCYAPDNCPDMSPEVNWMNTEYLPNLQFSSEYLVESTTAVMSTTITFTPTHKHNGKLLGCKVQYPNTTYIYERIIALDVKYAPRAVEVNVSTDVMEGSMVILHCLVDSNPPSRISWVMLDTELQAETSLNSSLVIESIESGQEGVYTCVADNGYGTMNRSLYLAVKYPPREPLVNESSTVVEGSNLHLHCRTQGNPVPTLTWLKDGNLVGNIIAEEHSVLEIEDITYEGDGEYRCLAENEHGRASSVINITVEFAPVFLLESKCMAVREGIQCVCVASGNPEPAIEFHLPDLNVTINETESRFNYYTHSDGYVATSMIKLKDKPASGLNVLCTMTNIYGTETVRLELQQERKYILAVIIGTIGGVAVIGFIIAAVRYISRKNQKENANPGQDLTLKLESPALFYSAVKKEKPSLRKKVLKTELLGTKFNSILEEPSTETQQADYQH
ncbi:myelin-associated glycoprotein isoform X3 [Amia ocellicauda]|uniref:myelin-associated glycoprotein isoform X3 n=1 Tax=Amia ocellicauda TaxID=2972642 RepID=UPI0034640C0E